MGFELKILQNEDLDLIYKTAESAGMLDELRARSWMGMYLGNFKFVIDHDEKIFMFPLRVDRDDARERFILGFKGGIVVFFEEEYCLYSIERISPNLLELTEAIEFTISEIFLYFGAYLDGEKNRHPVPSTKVLWNVGGVK